MNAGLLRVPVEKCRRIFGPMRRQGMPDLAVEGTFDVLVRTAMVRNARTRSRVGARGRRLGGARVEVLKELRGGRKIRRRIGGIAFLRMLKAHRRMPAGRT